MTRCNGLTFNAKLRVFGSFHRMLRQQPRPAIPEITFDHVYMLYRKTYLGAPFLLLHCLCV